MDYRFQGNVQALISADWSEPLAAVTVRIYRSDPLGRAAPVARPKDSFAILMAAQAGEKADLLLAAVQTDANGDFVVSLGQAEGYDGEAFDIDIYLTGVPGQPAQGPAHSLQCSLATVQPRWRQGDTACEASWQYCLPQRIWCYIRGLFGAWVLCGRLRESAYPHAPIAGATVDAFDADLWHDDALGTAISDADGCFRIDYGSDNFRLAGLSPDVGAEWASGPDVYFVARLGRRALVSEYPEDGRRPGRENTAPCAYVELWADQALGEGYRPAAAAAIGAPLPKRQG